MLVFCMDLLENIFKVRYNINIAESLFKCIKPLEAIL